MNTYTTKLRSGDRLQTVARPNRFKKNISLSVLSLLFTGLLPFLTMQHATGQENKSSWSMSGGLFSEGALLSIHGEYAQMIKSPVWLTAGTGMGFNKEFNISFFGNKAPERSYLILPHHLTVLIGNKLFFETGIGGHFAIPDEPYMIFPIVGFRFQRMDNTLNLFSFRLSLHVPVNGDELEYIFMPVGLTIGVTL